MKSNDETTTSHPPLPFQFAMVTLIPCIALVQIVENSKCCLQSATACGSKCVLFDSPLFWLAARNHSYAFLDTVLGTRGSLINSD